MKAGLKFDLSDPEDRESHLQCVHAFTMTCMLLDIKEFYCRVINEKMSEKDFVSRVGEVLQQIDVEDLIS